MRLWSDRADAVILPVLDGIPLGASRQECQKALSEVYPFGPREHHPYKAWLKQVKRHLDRRFGSKAGELPEPPRHIIWFGDQQGVPPRLVVSCGWCRNKVETCGCIVCGHLAEQVRRVEADPMYAPLRESAADDPVAMEALRDWLEERGIDVRGAMS